MFDIIKMQKKGIYIILAVLAISPIVFLPSASALTITHNTGLSVNAYNANQTLRIFTTNNPATTSCSAGQHLSAYSNSTWLFTCTADSGGSAITGGSNIGHGGKGPFSGTSGTIMQFKNDTSLRTDLITINANTTDITFNSNFKSDNISCSAGNHVSAFNNSTGVYTCSADSGGGSMTGGSNIGHGGKGPFAGTSGTIMQFKNNTSIRSDLFTISANATDVTFGSNFKSNTITCSSQFISAFNNATGLYTCATAITSINSQTGPSITIAGVTGNTTVTQSTNTITVNTGTNVVVTGGSAQTFTKNLDLGANTANVDTFDGNGIVIRNPAHTFGSTLAGGAVTANTTLTLPTVTSTLAMHGASNFTSPANQTQSGSIPGVMWGGPVQITPVTTGTVNIYESGFAKQSIAGSGVILQIRYGTGAPPANGAGLTGTTIGQPLYLIFGSNPDRLNTSMIGQVTGLTLGTKYWFELGVKVQTSGNINISNLNWLAQEIG